MNPLKYGVGLDISKDMFDACISVIDTEQKITIKATSRFSNSLKGFNNFWQWAKRHLKLPLPAVYLMEATGVYHEQFAWFLYDKQAKVVVILPNKAKKYKESLGLKSKNDTIDAEGLSRMVCEQNLRFWQPLTKDIYILRMITRQIESISCHCTVIHNQLHALGYGMFQDRAVEKMLEKQLALLFSQKDELEKRVENIVEQNPVLKEKFEKILPIKGLGVQTLAVVVAETDGFALIENQAQLVSYAGYDVVQNQSGKHSGKTKISKKGNSHIRHAMHFPAFNVVKYDQGNLKNLYERVYDRTKIKMKGYTAVQRKLLTLIYALWKRNEKFDSNKGKNATSGDTESVSSFVLKPIIVNEKVFPKNKTAPVLTGAALDEHPSKRRRMPSFV